MLNVDKIISMALFLSYSMDLVHEQYSKLQSAINELGEKVTGVLTKQENDFLGAYRTHMRNVQNDFNEIRLEVEEKERAIENNVKVKELEKERNWYRKEATHLDKVLQKTQINEEKLREKVEELEEDRSWLTKQLRIVMKQKATLEYQLDKIYEDNDLEERYRTMNVDIKEEEND